MNSFWSRFGQSIAAALVVLQYLGCNTPSHSYREPVEHLGHAGDEVTFQVSYGATAAPPATVCGSLPDEFSDFAALEQRPITLDEAIEHALANSQLIRVGPNGNAFAPRASAIDIALQDAGYLFGSRGRAAALSDFDPTLSASTSWGRDELIQNNRFLSGGIAPGDTLVGENASFLARLSKSTRDGGELSVSHGWNYGGSNRTDLLFPSAYTGDLGVQYRKPLLAGAGRDVVDITGPRGSQIQGVTDLSQGIAIAKLNTDIAVLDFEQRASELIFQVESLYWQLCSQYQVLNSLEEYRDSLAPIARIANKRFEINARGGRFVEHAEVEQTILAASMQHAQQQSAIRETEHTFRQLLHSRIAWESIYIPQERITTAPILHDLVHLARHASKNRTELKRQRTENRKLRRQLLAAKNLTLPSVDFLASYNVNAFGDSLFSNEQQQFSSAYGTLFDGQQEGWGLGFRYTRSLGNRLPTTRLRNIQLQLTKGEITLADLEAQVQSQVVGAVRSLHLSNMDVKAYEERIELMKHHCNAVEAQFEVTGDGVSLLSWLRAVQQLASLQIEIEDAKLRHTLADLEVRRQAGTVLSLAGITIDGPAMQMFWRRSIRKRKVDQLAAPEPTI